MFESKSHWIKINHYLTGTTFGTTWSKKLILNNGDRCDKIDYRNEKKVYETLWNKYNMYIIYIIYIYFNVGLNMYKMSFYLKSITSLKVINLHKTVELEGFLETCSKQTHEVSAHCL